MTDRERFLRTMLYGEFDRVPYVGGMGPWPETVERWKGEGRDERTQTTS